MEIRKKYEELSDGIVRQIENANVFFSKEYSEYAKNIDAELWFVYDDNYIIPILIRKKIRIKRALLVSEPFCFSNLKNNIVLEEFLTGTCKLLRKEGVAWVNSGATAFFAAYPNESNRIPFGSHVIDLSQTEEQLWMNMHSKHRNSVRRAEKSGIYVRFGGISLVSDYLKVDAETWERSGRSSYGKKFFENIVKTMENKAVLYVAYKEEKPQASACFFMNRKMCYYMYGASITKPEPGAANLLQWVAIKNMKKMGIEKYSFVGCRINEDKDSKYHGIQRFKERFGGQLKRGYMFKEVLSPGKYLIFSKLYQIKNGCVMTDAVEQEKHKWVELQSIRVEDINN